MANIYSRIYKKLEGLGVMDVTESVHLKSQGFMDLVIERLQENHYSLTHYFEQNGDLCPDPDMTIKIVPEMKIAEALTYQDQFCYRVVYPDLEHVNIKAKKELNAFLDQWLSNLKEQGFTWYKVPR
ncbi:Uncharacterised protein [uncultured archaeon]|nr:Uncharacterised protein [uncultured archaeon]